MVVLRWQECPTSVVFVLYYSAVSIFCVLCILPRLFFFFTLVMSIYVCFAFSNYLVRWNKGIVCNLAGVCGI